MGSVAHFAAPERIPDTRLDPRYIVDDFRLSELAVPIMLNGHCIGVIDTEHREVEFYTERHEEWLPKIESIAATKISGANRAQELAETIDQLEATRMICHQREWAIRQMTNEGVNASKPRYTSRWPRTHPSTRL